MRSRGAGPAEQVPFCPSVADGIPDTPMPFVTKLTFRSGDRRLLEETVTDLKERAERKGVELKGPHPKPPADYAVPQQRTLSPEGDSFGSWRYTVYERTLEVVGHDGFARDLSTESYPTAIHLEAEVEQITQLGEGN
jgi:small subunit ribosomal protein S10